MRIESPIPVTLEMSSRPRVVLVPLLAVLAGGLALAASTAAPVFDVRVFGAKGDGQTVDTQAINAAIEAAATAGGGTVYLPAGTYPSFSIRLKSHITLELGPGATLLAADTGAGARATTTCRSRTSTTSTRTSATATGRTA